LSGAFNRAGGCLNRQNGKELVTIKKFTKNPLPTGLINRKSLKWLVMVNVKTSENRRDGTRGAIFFKQGATKLRLLKVFYWRFLDDRVCNITVEKCVDRLNRNSWGRSVKAILNKGNIPYKHI
jgi:hypothetical protein